MEILVSVLCKQLPYFLRTYEVCYKSNENGNAVHEPTTLLPPPSHGS